MTFAGRTVDVVMEVVRGAVPAAHRLTAIDAAPRRPQAALLDRRATDQGRAGRHSCARRQDVGQDDEDGENPADQPDGGHDVGDYRTLPEPAPLGLYDTLL